MSHYRCHVCHHEWNTAEPPSMGIDANTPAAVVDGCLIPDECPICHAWDGREDDELCRLAVEEFANATSEQREVMIQMVRDAARDIRAYWMAPMLGWPTIEYADMTDEQKRIVDAGDDIADQFPDGLTKEQLN